MRSRRVQLVRRAGFRANRKPHDLVNNHSPSNLFFVRDRPIPVMIAFCSCLFSRLVAAGEFADRIEGRSEAGRLWLERSRAEFSTQHHVRHAGLLAARDGRGATTFKHRSIVYLVNSSFS